MIAVETNRLLLRNYRVTDFEDIVKYFSDEEVSKYEDFYHGNGIQTDSRGTDNKRGDIRSCLEQL